MLVFLLCLFSFYACFPFMLVSPWETLWETIKQALTFLFKRSFCMRFIATFRVTKISRKKTILVSYALVLHILRRRLHRRLHRRLRYTFYTILHRRDTGFEGKTKVCTANQKFENKIGSCLRLTQLMCASIFNDK